MDQEDMEFFIFLRRIVVGVLGLIICRVGSGSSRITLRAVWFRRLRGCLARLQSSAPCWSSQRGAKHPSSRADELLEPVELVGHFSWSRWSTSFPTPKSSRMDIDLEFGQNYPRLPSITHPQTPNRYFSSILPCPPPLQHYPSTPRDPHALATLAAAAAAYPRPTPAAPRRPRRPPATLPPPASSGRTAACRPKPPSSFNPRFGR